MSLLRHKQADDAAAESTAIVAIGRALSALPDAEARLRVLCWANEHFKAPATIAAQAPVADAAVVAGDPLLSLEGVHAFFEPAALRRQTNDAPPPVADDELGDDLFDEPVLGGCAEIRVVARKEETHAPTGSDDLRDVYEEIVAQHPELEAAVGDVYEQPAACDALLDEPIGDLYDEPVMEYPAAIDDPLDLLYEEQIGVVCEEPIAVGCAEATTEEPLPGAQAAACEDQSLDALVADLASALQSLTLQLHDASA